MELVDGWYAWAWGEDSVAYVLLSTAEELLEMAGVAVFIPALLSHLGARAGRLRVAVVTARPGCRSVTVRVARAAVAARE